MAKKVVILVVVIGVIVAFKMKNQGDDSATIQAEMQKLIAALPCAGDSAEYLDSLIVRHHNVAFREAYTMGGRRTKARFDQDKYIENILTRMIKAARDAGKPDLVDCLQEARAILLADDS